MKPQSWQLLLRSQQLYRECLRRYGSGLYRETVFGCFDPTSVRQPRERETHICCGPHISNTDFAILKTISFSDTRRIDFRAEFFNIFNHSQFYTPDGNTSDGSQFGQITQTRDPRLVQFALKFFF